MTTTTRLPIDIAFHYLGCARCDDGVVAVPSPFGPLIEALATRVDRVCVLAYDPPSTPGPEDATDHRVTTNEKNVVHVSLGPKGSMRTYLRRRRFVRDVVSRQGTWDVVMHRLPNRRAGLVEAGDRRSRLVVSMEGYGPEVVRLMPYPPLRKLRAYGSTLLAERTHRAMMRRAGYVVANSGALAARYRSVAPAIEVLMASSRHEWFMHETTDRFATDAPQIVVAGRVSRPKGVFEALVALAEIRRTVSPRAVLHVVGDGEALDDLRAEARQTLPEDAVVFHGWVSDQAHLRQIYTQMDVMLMLSHAESFPRVVEDAMAHSVPVIATPVGGLGTDLRDEVDCLHVPIADPAAVVRAFARLRDDAALRNDLIAKGLENARSWSVEAITTRLIQRIGETWPELRHRSSESRS